MPLKTYCRVDKMPQQITPISTAQALIQRDLFAFTNGTISALFNLDQYQTRRLLDRMEQAGLAQRVERGKFILLGLTPEKTLANPLFIGCHLATPSYISFWSALHFHGFTEQAPRSVFAAVTRQKKRVEFHGTRFQFVALRPASFFGYRRESLADLPVTVADEPKSILDSLALPQYAGGIVEAAKALQVALREGRIELPILVEYAMRLRNASLASRLGYLLDLLGQPADGLAASKGPLKLAPQRAARGRFVRRWQVYVNVETDELFPQGVA